MPEHPEDGRVELHPAPAARAGGVAWAPAGPAGARLGAEEPPPEPLPPDQDVPPGWDYNPSIWPQRLPVVGLALLGFAIAAYLAAFQYKLVPSVWEPFFGDGSRRVLTSKLSHVLPISDGALGALSYLLDAITGVIGGTKRWRTMPWIVILFGLAVGPLGAVSIALVMSQPLVVGAWCTLCLASAVVSLAMIGPAMDEMLASLQWVKREKARGRSAWRVFWGLGEK